MSGHAEWHASEWNVYGSLQRSEEEHVAQQMQGLVQSSAALEREEKDESKDVINSLLELFCSFPKEKGREGRNIAERQGKKLLASPKGLTLFVLSFLLSSLDYVGYSLCLLHLQVDLQTELCLASKMTRRLRACPTNIWDEGVLSSENTDTLTPSFLVSPIISFICLNALRLSRPNIRTQSKQRETVDILVLFLMLL